MDIGEVKMFKDVSALLPVAKRPQIIKFHDWIDDQKCRLDYADYRHL